MEVLGRRRMWRLFLWFVVAVVLVSAPAHANLFPFNAAQRVRGPDTDGSVTDVDRASERQRPAADDTPTSLEQPLHPIRRRSSTDNRRLSNDLLLRLATNFVSRGGRTAETSALTVKRGRWSTTCVIKKFLPTTKHNERPCPASLPKPPEEHARPRPGFNPTGW